MSKSFIYNSYVDADFDPIPKPSSSSSATLTASSSHHHHRQQQQQQPHQSSQSSTRQRLTQTERMKQLQDLDQHIAEATHWSRRRAEMVTTSTSSSRYRQSMDATRKTSTSNFLPSQRSSMETDMNDTSTTNATDEDSSCLDLREASLEDLEGLIAASAQRLANYRLKRKSQQHQQLSATNDTTTSPISASTTSSSCSLPSHGGADEKTHTVDTSSSPPLPSVYTNKENNKKSSLHRILPTSLSSQHYSLVVDKEKKFSLVSPTSPSLSSFRRSYQMTSPPVPVGATTSSSQLKKREQQRMKNQYSSSPPSPTAATTANANKLSAGSSRLVSSVSSSSGLAALLDSTSTSSSSSASSPSSSTSSDHHITKSSSQQRSSLPSSSRRRLRTLSTLAQQSSTSSLESPCTSRSSIGLSLTSEKPTVRTTSTGPSIRQRTQSTTTQHSPQDTTTRKSLDSTTTTTRQQRTRHVSMLTKPSSLTSPPVRLRKTSMVTTTTTPLLRKQPQDGATEDSTTTTTDTSDNYRRPRVVSQTHSPNKPAAARLRVSSTTTTAASNTVVTPRSIRDTPAANKIGIKQSNKPTGRKRGKTLPGSLATPPPKPLTLPPIKVEPIHQQDNPNMRPSAKTPTRIPLLKTSRSQNANTATDEDRDIDDDAEDDVHETIPSTKASAPNNQSSASYIAPPGMLGTNTSKTTLRVDPILRKQHSSVTMRTSTSQVTSNSSNNSKQSGHHHYSNKSSTSLMDATSSHARTRKISTISTRTGLGVSASVKPTEKSSDPRRNRVPTLHERLQALVNESNSWRSSTNSGHTKSTTTSTPLSTSSHKKEKIVIRGGGHSTTTSNTTASGDDTAIVFQGGQALTPQQGMKQGGYYLTDFEKIEMQQYPAIYFMGQPDCNKRNQQQQQQNKKSGTTEWNDGYDDERGDYHIVLRDHLAYRYEVLSVLGKGSFGQVLKCLDHKSGLTVAVKLIRNKKRFHSQAMVEINILKQLVQWDKDDVHHNVRMKDHFSFRNHLCLVFECLSINLYDFIKSNHFQGFSMGLIKRFTVQILQSLSLLHKHKLIHCDLKPENILLKSPNKSAIKVIDFGSSCLENEKVYTYIQSRFYRSPEVILGMNYGMAIDMWSVGCILAELYSGYPLFPGENEQEQLACIMEIMDVPAMALIEKSARRKLFFDAIGQPRIVANAKGKKRYPRTKTLEQVLQQKRTSSTGSSETFALFVDFLHQCFQWDPAHRITPDQAFQHPWIRHSSAISSPSSKKHSSPPL